MGSTKFYSLIIIVVIFSVALCAALFFSYGAYVASNRIEKNFKLSLGALEQEVNRLRTQLAAVKNRTEDNAPQRYAATAKSVTEKSKKDTVGGEREAVRRLEKIVESTGLEQLAANEDMDPTVLSEMYAEFADRRQAVLQHEQLLEINTELHKADEHRYGPELMALYERARLRRRGDSDRQESERAFAELLAKYPDAYATGMAIAERALFSGFRRDTSEVEKYYDMLRQNDNFSNVITDRGVEAMPNIEYYLARQYLRLGNIDNALPLIESLEKNYADSRLFTRRPGNQQRWQPASQVIPRLRDEVDSLR